MQHSSIGRSIHFVTFLDSFSGYSMVRFFARKSEAAAAVIEVITKTENLLWSDAERLIAKKRNTFKWIRSYGSGRYITRCFHLYLNDLV